MTQRSETGRGRLSSLLWLAFFVGLGYAAWHVGPAYYANWTLTDKMEEIARTPFSARADEVISKSIRDAIRECELQGYVDEHDFKVTSADVTRTITVAYEREAEILPGWKHTFRFVNRKQARVF
jgi:hypothetical protein